MAKLCRQACASKLPYALNVAEVMFLAVRQQRRLNTMKKTLMEKVLKVQMQQVLSEAILT